MAASTDLIVGEKITLVWTIKNFAYYPCKTNECIQSPKFFMKNRMSACWRLYFYPKGSSDAEYSSCAVRLEDPDGNEKKCKFDSNLSIILGKPSLNGINADWIIRRNKCLDINRTELLNKRPGSNTLTIYCDIWDSNSEPIRTIFCSARTVISKETSYSICRIKDFSLRQPNEVYNYHIYFASQNLPLFVMSVLLVGVYTLSGGKYQIQMKKWKRRNQTILNKKPVFVSSRISLLDKNNGVGDYVADEFIFGDEQEERVWNLPYFITKKHLMANHELYLPDDTLSLLCEVSLSYGVISEQIELCSYHLPKSLKTHEALCNILSESETLLEKMKNKRDQEEEKHGIFTTRKAYLIEHVAK